MTKPEGRAGVSSDQCYALPSDVESTRTRCTPKGCCRVGMIVSKGGPESLEVWLEVATGLVKLIRQTDASTHRAPGGRTEVMGDWWLGWPMLWLLAPR